MFPGAITSVGEKHLYSMDAIAGETYYIKLTRLTGTFSPKVTILSPSGPIVATGSDSINLKMVTEMPVTGTYNLTVEDSSGKNTGDYAFSMQSIQYPSNANRLDMGVEESGSITVPGTVDSYTFQGDIRRCGQCFHGYRIQVLSSPKSRLSRLQAQSC